MDRSLNTLRSPQPFTCRLEVAASQEDGHDDADEHIIRVATIAGRSLLSVSISRELGQRLAPVLVQAIPFIDIDGSVRVQFEDETQQENQLASVALDQLVAAAVSSDMLDDEPDAKQMLFEFRTRLLKSLEHVERAIASLQKD